MGCREEGGVFDGWLKNPGMRPIYQRVFWDCYAEPKDGLKGVVQG